MIYLILMVLVVALGFIFTYFKNEIDDLKDNLKFKTGNLWDALEAVEDDLRKDIKNNNVFDHINEEYNRSMTLDNSK